MEWHDDGIVLSARKHGESSTIVNLLTREHGRHTGFVRGGAGRSARGVYQPGNGVSARWSARLPEHLGTFQCELTVAVAVGSSISQITIVWNVIVVAIGTRSIGGITVIRRAIFITVLGVACRDVNAIRGVIVVAVDHKWPRQKRSA